MGERLDRHVYLKPPVEANSKGKLWKLNICVYGLCDASRHLYLKGHNVMIEHGAQISNLDQAIFYWRKEDSLHGWVAAHVDDIFGAGTAEFEALFISKIKSSFLVGSEETQGFKYIGLDVEQSSESINFLSSKLY